MTKFTSTSKTQTILTLTASARMESSVSLGSSDMRLSAAELESPSALLTPPPEEEED